MCKKERVHHFSVCRPSGSVTCDLPLPRYKESKRNLYSFVCDLHLWSWESRILTFNVEDKPQNTTCQVNSLNMLEIFAYPLLRTRRRHMLFQLDGAPPHWGLQVRAFLNDTFLECWIGRSGPAAWLPRSPDINSLDFFLWGYVKIEVFKSLQHLKDQISQAFALSSC